MQFNLTKLTGRRGCGWGLAELGASEGGGQGPPQMCSEKWEGLPTTHQSGTWIGAETDDWMQFNLNQVNRKGLGLGVKGEWSEKVGTVGYSQKA